MSRKSPNHHDAWRQARPTMEEMLPCATKAPRKRDQHLEELKELRASLAEMKQSEALYIELFEQAPIGYLNLTRAGRIQNANFAAASLLNDLHRQFGDWNLAMAAYHQGPGAVRRAIADGGTRSVAELEARGLLVPYRAGVTAAVLVMREPGLLE